jgi:hypothetical protein
MSRRWTAQSETPSDERYNAHSELGVTCAGLPSVADYD